MQYAGIYMHQPSNLSLTVADSGGSNGRPYTASTGTFLGRDPMGEDGGLNLYIYCNNQAITQSDRDGLSPAPAPPTMSVVPGDTGPMSQEVHVSATDSTCKDIRFIQVVKSFLSGDDATDGSDGDSPYYANMSSMGSTAAIRDWPGAGKMDGDKRVNTNPGPLLRLFGLTMEFETCAYCVDNEADPRIIGCRHWKVHWDSNGKETFEGAGNDLPPQPPTPFYTDMQQSRTNFYKP
jgi:RHS repeat-associated protein